MAKIPNPSTDMVNTNDNICYTCMSVPIYIKAIPNISPTSSIVMNVLTRELLAGEERSSFDCYGR